MFDVGDLRWGLRICICNKFPGEVDAAGQGPHLENHRIVKTVALKTPSPGLDLYGINSTQLCFKNGQETGIYGVSKRRDEKVGAGPSSTC